MYFILEDLGQSMIRISGDNHAEHPWQPNGTLCWHCCHDHGDHPIPMPLDYDERRRTYKVLGTFCSFACMTAYCRDSKMHAAMGKRGMAIFQLWREMTKSTSPKIPRAPPRQFLDVFGGTMSIDEFRSASTSETYDEVPNRCIHHSQLYIKKPVHSTSSKQGKPSTTIEAKQSAMLKMKHTSNVVPKEPTRKSSGPTLLEKALGL